MIYIVDSTDGTLHGACSKMTPTQQDKWESMNANFIFPTYDGHIPLSLYPYYRYIDGVIKPIAGTVEDDPFVTAVTINAYRDELVMQPLLIDNSYYDITPVSRDKMNTIAAVVRESDHLLWTTLTGENTAFTGAEFKLFVIQVNQYFSTRLYNYHFYAKNLKTKLPYVYQSDLTVDKWGDGLEGMTFIRELQ